MAVAERGSSGGWIRVVTAVLLAVAVLVPVATIATWASVDNADSRESVETERRGVEYLQPLTRLLSVIVASQSAAVRGDQIETAALETELAAVERVEAANGSALSTRARWPVVRDSIRELAQRPGQPGSEAYQRWSQAVDLTVALIRRVGDTSHLILDPELDSSYLVDAGLVRLPEIIQAAGQIADLAVINRDTFSATDARASVLRDRIASNAAAVATGLGKVVDATDSGTVGSAMLSPLDQFGAATDALAPSVAVAVMPPLPSNLPAASVGVRDASQRLSQTVWAELDRLLADRLDDFSVRRIQIYSAAALGLLAAIVVGVLLWMRRRPGPVRPAESASQAPDGPDGRDGRDGRDGYDGRGTPGGYGGGYVGFGAPEQHGQPYPSAYTGPNGDPAVSAIVGTPRSPAGAR